MAQSDRATIGIDFGTTTCFISRDTGAGRAEILPLGRSRRYLSSLAGHIGGSFVVGEDAEILTPDRIIRSVKTAITNDTRTVPVGGRDGTTEVDRDDVVIAIFREIANRADANGWPLGQGQPLRLGCPAMWLRPQRDLLLGLAASAGLHFDPDALIEEPVAAGIAWLNKRVTAREPVEGQVLVFDMGGGTLDIAVMHVSSDPPRIAVLTSVGLQLAGDALDEAVVADLCQERAIDLSTLPDPLQARADLLRQAQDTKVALSTAPTQTVYFEPFFYGSRIQPVRYTRERLNAVFAPQMEEAEAYVLRALRLARLAHVGGASWPDIRGLATGQLARDIDYVLLVGGMSRVPLVRDRLTSLLPHAIIDDSVGVAADEAIVAGLPDSSGYNTMNMYRPAIDIELTWDPDHHVALYEAYTPLFENWHLQSGHSKVGHTIRLSERQGIPRQRTGSLRIATVGGDPVKIVHTKATIAPRPETTTAVPVPFGSKEIVFKLYSDGHAHLTDGAGHAHELRIDGWPIIGNQDVDPEPPDPPVPYPHNKP